jgi:hypothetical protein
VTNEDQSVDDVIIFIFLKQFRGLWFQVCGVYFAGTDFAIAVPEILNRKNIIFKIYNRKDYHSN